MYLRCIQHFVVGLFTFETGSGYVAQAVLKLVILLPQPPEYGVTGEYHYAWLQHSILIHTYCYVLV
jgi:hypothetical protein